MPFIPHTDQDIQAMLAAIGIGSLTELFDEIPEELTIDGLSQVPEGVSEMELARLMRERALRDIGVQCFIGAGAYEHHIPAAVWDIASRGEYMTAYTPYQAEASQGTLQLIYEYQTMMSQLTAMDVSNASLYDGATSVVEAILMALRVNRRVKSNKVLVAGTLNPLYRDVLNTLLLPREIELIEVPFGKAGHLNMESFNAWNDEPIAAVLIQQPNFFGQFEPVDALTDWAHRRNAMVIGVVNPTALALIKPPGQWGELGADIACGEGQPLGVPLASGGPYFGFLCAKSAYVRQMPGRIVGRTVDEDGAVGYALTLQAREQHIRRAKATSNICTNQGLMVTAATIYMSLLGAQGLKQVISQSHANTKKLTDKLLAIPGVERVFQGAYCHEVLIRLPVSLDHILPEMAKVGILAGYDCRRYFPELGECLLVCATETKSAADLDQYVEQLTKLLAKQTATVMS